MAPIHGIIACGGNGSRFAESVGKTYPYPKHLEPFGDRPLIQTVVDSLIANVGIESVTFTPNVYLQDAFVSYLAETQSVYPEIRFSYSPTIPDSNHEIFTNIKDTLNSGVYDLLGNRIELGNPLVVIAFGDQVVSQGDSTALQGDIHALLPLFAQGESFAVLRDTDKGGIVYWFQNLNDLNENPYDFGREAIEYRIKWWNCNTKKELLAAKEGMGMRLAADEEALLCSRYGKEIF